MLSPRLSSWSSSLCCPFLMPPYPLMHLSCRTFSSSNFLCRLPKRALGGAERVFGSTLEARSVLLKGPGRRGACFWKAPVSPPACQQRDCHRPDLARPRHESRGRHHLFRRSTSQGPTSLPPPQRHERDFREIRCFVLSAYGHPEF